MQRAKSVSGIDEDKGLIYLNPLPNNMWVTGVGVGGAPIGDHEREIQGGDYENKRTEELLQRIQSRSYSVPGDVAYILKGTVPTQVGPNGSQGGGYSCKDHNARGYEQGLDTKQIIQSDATSLKRMGFDVPVKALDASIDPYLWNDFVNSQSHERRPEKMAELMVPGEDMNDPAKLSHFALHHRDPDVKKRNFERLESIIDGWAEARRLRNDLYRGSSTNPLYQGKEGQDRLYAEDEKIDKAVKAGQFSRPDLLPTLRDVISKMPEMQHPHKQNLGYDAYATVKEKGMYSAQRHGWKDLLQKFEGDSDRNVRHFLINVYIGAYDPAKINGPGLLRVERNETDPDNLQHILYALSKVNTNLRQVVGQNPRKYLEAIQSAGQQTYEGYYGKELKDFLQRYKLMDLLSAQNTGGS